MKMKNHVSTQSMLVEEFINSFHSEIILEKLDNMNDEFVEDLEVDFPSWMETHMQNTFETMDILMSEHRMEEALVVLEKENQTLQKLQKEKDNFSPIISLFARAISDWRARLAEHFASLAGHWRVTRPELHAALFGLCRLGENDHACVLLLKFFHLQLENSVNELKSSALFPNRTYMLELTELVFSTISRAARSFVLLFGEASPYTSDLMQWARVELEAIFHSIDMYVKSISETSFALGLAVETMNISFSFCSLLEHQRLSLQFDVIKLMRPCITELLRMHFDQLRKVVSLFASTDNWVLGKFLISGKLSNNPHILEINGKLEYLRLTSSGRKFITLVQMILDDTFPFQAFHLENLILEGLSDLFDEYTLNLERAIKTRGHVEKCDFTSIVSAQKLHQQISILVNSFELVHLVPTFVQNSFSATRFSSDVVLPEQDKLSLLKGLDLWKQTIQKASDRLKCCFCLLFVSGVLSPGNCESMKDLEICSCSHCIPGSLEDPMPSFVFQELFVRLRHLQEQFKFILLAEDGMSINLLNGILMSVICRLSENLEFLQSVKTHKQLLLDVHFLIEMAMVGGYFSDNLMVAALDLMAIMKEKLSAKEFHLNSKMPEEQWASNVAKLAIKTLLEAEISETYSKYNPAVDSFNKCTEDSREGVQKGMDGFKVNEEHALCTGESRVRVDGEFVNSVEDSTTSKTQIQIIEHLQNPMTGAIDFGLHHRRSSSPTIFSNCMEDVQAAAECVTISDRLSGTSSIDELNMDDFIRISEEESGNDSDLDTIAAHREIDKLTDISGSENNRVEIQLLSVLQNLELNGNLEHQDGNVNVSISSVSDVENFAKVIESPSNALNGEAIPVLQTCCLEVTEACHLVASLKGFQYGSCDGKGELSRTEFQHSKEKPFALENDQNDRTEAAVEMNTCDVQHFELKLLASHDTDLSLEGISNADCSGADPLAIATNDQRDTLVTDGGQERPKHAKAVDGFKHSRLTERLKQGRTAANVIGKNNKGRTTRPQWQ